MNVLCQNTIISSMADVNECLMAALESVVICMALSTQCVNTEGSFQCVCVDGYELVDGECQRKIINLLKVLSCL